jgi:hypothetical protein
MVCGDVAENFAVSKIDREHNAFVASTKDESKNALWQ